jgi:hypothetical protein
MLSPRLLDLLRSWWRVARPTTWLFPGTQPGQPVSKDAVEQACPKARRRGRMPKPISPARPWSRIRGPSFGNQQRIGNRIQSGNRMASRIAGSVDPSANPGSRATARYELRGGNSHFGDSPTSASTEISGRSCAASLWPINVLPASNRPGSTRISAPPARRQRTAGSIYCSVRPRSFFHDRREPPPANAPSRCSSDASCFRGAPSEIGWHRRARVAATGYLGDPPTRRLSITRLRRRLFSLIFSTNGSFQPPC